MKNNMLKLVAIIVFIMIFCMYCMVPYSYAAGTAMMDDGAGAKKNGITSTNTSGSSHITSVPDTNGFDPRDKKTADDEKLLEKANKIIGWIETIGVAISVLALSILGIRYMVGSVEEKAKFKEKAQPYIIVCVLTFGILTVLKIISDIAKLI